MLTLAVAVALVALPERGELVAVIGAANVGVAVRVIVEPTGTPEVSNATVMGFAVAAGSVTSMLPVGDAGAETPATEVIFRFGCPARNTGPGTSIMGPGLFEPFA